MRWHRLEGKRVAVFGFGHEGRAACRAFRLKFPEQPLTLLCTEQAAAAATALNDARLDIDTRAVSVEALRAFDIVIKSPGISPYKSPIPEAQAAGVQFTSGSAIWFAEHPHANTIAVTGTKGKSTTTALIAHLLRSGGRRTALAGNIGLPLLDLPEDDAVAAYVLELSSFQTCDFGGGARVALITNLMEEHLDWHVTCANYVADKLRILGKGNRTIAVLNADDPLLRALPARANTLWFGTDQRWRVTASAIYRDQQRVLDLAALPLPGLHNAQNLCGALAAIEAAGFDAVQFAQHVASFRPLPHRLQTLGTRGDITYVNDSISTTPQATIAALSHFAGRRVALLVGGHERGLDWQAFADFVAAHPPLTIVTMGANGARIGNLLAKTSLGDRVQRASNLHDACARALHALDGAGILLLSPGAPSFGEFRDYVERGRVFAELAGFDASVITHIEGLGIA